MQGEKYFKDRLIDIYEFSPVKYTCGSGTLIYIDNSIEISWELVVAISGEVLFFISSDVRLGLMLSSQTNEHNIDISGVSSCANWIIQARTVSLDNVNFSNSDTLNKSLISCSAKEIELTKTIHSENYIKHLRGWIYNFNFLGLETSTYGNLMVRDKFTANIHSRNVVFKQLIGINKIKEQIKINRISRAMLSTVTVPILNVETIQEVVDLLQKITWMISFLNINTNMSPVVEYWTDSEPTKINIRGLVSSPYHGNVIINNQHVESGIKIFLENYFDIFQKFDKEINLRKFVGNLLGMYEAKYIEHKIAGLVLSIEYLLTKYLIYRGQSDEIAILSIQDKLKRVNTYLRFIPSEYLGDGIRKDVRNPLFHSGELALLNGSEIYKYYSEYFDLLIQIFLRIIDYKGGYISRKDYNTVIEIQ